VNVTLVSLSYLSFSLFLYFMGACLTIAYHNLSRRHFLPSTSAKINKRPTVDISRVAFIYFWTILYSRMMYVYLY